MALYRAKTLLYNKDMIENFDPESGTMRLVEAGYVHPGETIELEGERAEILLSLNYIELAQPEPEAPAPIESPYDETPQE